MVKQQSAYVYPNISRDRMGSNNPYIENLKRSLAANGFGIDRSVSKYAIYDLIAKGSRADVIILNWIENTSSRRFGLLQTLVVIVYLQLLKLTKVKIVWIRHNNVSHDTHRVRLKKLLNRMLIRRADLIITHSTHAGLPDLDKVCFMHHPNDIDPADIQLPAPSDDLPIDLLIWGTLLPYKGVLEFLRFAATDRYLGKLKIHIAGNCPNDDYRAKLLRLRSGNVCIITRYIPEEELKDLFQKSRFILFTYNKQSVSSSGVLVESLVASKRIIAPDCGAFRDIAQDFGFVSLYGEFSDIKDIYSAFCDDFILDRGEVMRFLSQNSWDIMGGKLKDLLLNENIQPNVRIEFIAEQNPVK